MKDKEKDLKEGEKRRGHLKGVSEREFSDLFRPRVRSSLT